jgi:RNA polymerase sigma-70 factor (ECF subfamily)
VNAERRFSALFEDTYPAVRRYAYNRGLQGADVDDLIADVFTVAWRRLDKVPTDDPVPWLLGVARNHWRNLLRRNRRDRELVLRVVPSPEAPDHEISPFSAEEIRAGLATLSESDQEVLRLVAWDGLTPQQAAKVLGCAATTARVRLHRARSRLAKAIGWRETDHRFATDTKHKPKEVPDGVS